MELSFKCMLVTILQQSEENSFKWISDYCHQTNVVLLKDIMLIFFPSPEILKLMLKTIFIRN